MYLTHQIFFAFYRYAFNDQFNSISYLALTIAALLLGFAFYFVLEKPISQYVSGNNKRVYVANGICTVIALLLISISGFYYMRGGLVHDIPELDMYVGENSETPEDHNATAWNFDKDFAENGKKNILVLGDSYGRDWVGVLRESGVDSVMNISYHDVEDEVLYKRLRKADVVFIATISCVADKYKTILPLVVDKKFYRVGVKGYGSWMGLVYNNDRYGSAYYEQKVPESEFSREENEQEQKLFGKRFIDMMNILKDENGNVCIFDDDHKLITQDGLHLTRAGAIMYAEKLNVWQYLK